MANEVLSCRYCMVAVKSSEAPQTTRFEGIRDISTGYSEWAMLCVGVPPADSSNNGYPHYTYTVTGVRMGSCTTAPGPAERVERSR